MIEIQNLFSSIVMKPDWMIGFFSLKIKASVRNTQATVVCRYDSSVLTVQKDCSFIPSKIGVSEKWLVHFSVDIIKPSNQHQTICHVNNCLLTLPRMRKMVIKYNINFDLFSILNWLCFPFFLHYHTKFNKLVSLERQSQLLNMLISG